MSREKRGLWWFALVPVGPVAGYWFAHMCRWYDALLTAEFTHGSGFYVLAWAATWAATAMLTVFAASRVTP